MKISELSAESRVSVPTIKYYLREGLLPPGEPTGPTQAQYDETHVYRLRLIRTLVEVGGLGIVSVRAVLDAIADETVPVHHLLGVAHRALGAPPDSRPVEDDVVQARKEVDGFLSELGWSVKGDAPDRLKLADALVALRRLGRRVGTEVFLPYAKAADELAAGELARLPAAAGAVPRAALVEGAVVGTVVFEAVLVALRKLAQEHHSAIRFGSASGRAVPPADAPASGPPAGPVSPPAWPR